jgi:2-polyprenyl-6-methoxyphenol hydroxylase-like FAD-dependent oxidoreductase
MTSNRDITNEREKTALVIGGSIAGLLAARVLSEQYSQVIIVERDILPTEPMNRMGTPQAFHPHGILPRGNRILQRLFPGLIDDLQAHGAFLMQAGKPGVFVLSTPYGDVDCPLSERGAGVSRALLEWELRRRLQTILNINFLTGQEAIGLVFNSDQSRVSGVRLRERGKLNQQQTLEAELVIDTSGSSSQLTQWLQAAGYTVAEPERVKGELGYTTGYYRLPARSSAHIGRILMYPQPSKGIPGAGLFPIENKNYMACLYLAGGQEYPPINVEGFEQTFSRLSSPLIAEALWGAELTTSLRGFRVPECIRQHYEQMELWPAGLLVMGDAFCYFDPVYGQGMSVAAMGAEVLEKCLQEQQVQPQANFELRTLQRLQEQIEPAWWYSAVSDLSWPGIEYSGPLSIYGLTLAQKCIELYLAKAIQAANTGERKLDLFYAYIMVNGLLISPRKIVNAQTIETLLKNDNSDVGQRLREQIDELTLGGQRSLEAMLDEIIPSFAHAFEDAPISSHREYTTP